MKKPSKASAHKPGPKVALLRRDIQPAQCVDLAHFIDSLGPRRSVHQALGITYVTLMRRLKEPSTLTVQELYRLAEVSESSMTEILQLLLPSLSMAGSAPEQQTSRPSDH